MKLNKIKKPGLNKTDWWIGIVLSMIAARPIIDFFPPLRDVETINVGGVWGALLFLIIAFGVFIFSKLRKNI